MAPKKGFRHNQETIKKMQAAREKYQESQRQKIFDEFFESFWPQRRNFIEAAKKLK